jgi:hypothetical protein
MANEVVNVAGPGRWRTSWKRVVLVLLSTFVGLWLLLLVVAHVSMWNLARGFARDNPIVAMTPQPLKDTTVADLKGGVIIHCFGYSVQVPWTKTKVVRDWKDMSFRSFDDGPTVVLEDHPTDILTSPAGEEASTRKAWGSLLGDHATRSHYDYAAVELNTRPSDVSFFHSRHANFRDYMLLVMKSVEIPHDSSAIYSIAAGQFRGFQFGDPQKLPSSVELLLFDGHDRALKLTLRGPKDGTRPALTQEQINGIVASIKPAAQ